MNKVILLGRLTRDPEIRHSSGENPMAIASYTLAVNRTRKNNGQEEADFFNCVVFGKSAEFAERYFKQGTKILIVGKVQNNNYTNKEGKKVYGVQILVDEQEFAESKSAYGKNNDQEPQKSIDESGDGFMNIPDGINEELPFN